ncbi:PASTA domain-containing protein [candidate division WOR-3 bacterium]|nr:PASTA domain-containing protein [candidate division WOR-3 bacterium]
MPVNKSAVGSQTIFNFILSIIAGSLVSALVMFVVSKISLFSLFKLSGINPSDLKKFFIFLALSYFLIFLLSLIWSLILSKFAVKITYGKSKKDRFLKFFFLSFLTVFSVTSGLSSGFVFTDNFIELSGLNPEKKQIPDLYGLNFESASSLLYENGLDSIPPSNIHFTSFNDQIPDSVIIRQDPPAGTYISNPSQIEIWINIHYEETDAPQDSFIVAPHLVGLPLERALQIISSKNLSFEVESVFCDTVQEGWIIGTLPEGGSQIVPGEMVNIYVSLGMEIIIVPSVVQMTFNEAELKLRESDLTIYLEGETADPSPPKTVLSQNPAAGDTSIKGDTVRVFVSSGIPDTMQF